MTTEDADTTFLILPSLFFVLQSSLILCFLCVLCASVVGSSIVPPARLNRPQCLDPSLAHGHTITMQVHRGAAMGRDHFSAVAHARTRPVALDRGVFLRQL